MNRERTKELLPIIQHFAEGGDIETKWREGWVANNDPTWTGGLGYRKALKPPKDRWENSDNDGGFLVFASKEDAQGNAEAGNWDHIAVHYRLVENDNE